jgi:phosphatidylglycerophosphate synthase
MWLPLARPFNMPLARELALWLRNTRITPNQVTLAGGALRVAGAVLAGFGSWPLNVVAAFMVEAAWTLDLTDGYLARLTRRTSAIGHWLDTFMDEVGTVAILAALAVGSMRATGQQVWLYVGLGALMASYLTSFGFWYDGLNAPIESAETVTGRNGSPPGKLSALPRRGLSALLSLHRSIDARPHVLAAGLLFNVPYVLVGFFAIAGGVSLIRYFQLQLRGRGP